jgi:chromosome segregation ATPase
MLKIIPISTTFKIIAFAFFLQASTAFAQMNAPAMGAQQTASAGVDLSEETSPGTPEWQLTLETIRSKSQGLLSENATLEAEQRSLQEQQSKLHSMREEWRAKNEEIRKFLKERKGRSDQDMRKEELAAQIRGKESQIKELQKQAESLKKKAAYSKKKVELKKLKMEVSRLDKKRGDLLKTKYKSIKESSLNQYDQEIAKMNQDLKAEQAAEEALQKKLNILKQGYFEGIETGSGDEGELRDLQKKLDELIVKKEDLQKRANVDNSSPAFKRYQALMGKKKDVESKIKDFEEQLNDLKDPGTFAYMRNPQRKETLKLMIELDGKNARLREKMSHLKEDLYILKQQVGRLERKLKHSNEE